MMIKINRALGVIIILTSVLLSFGCAESTEVYTATYSGTSEPLGLDFNGYPAVCYSDGVAHDLGPTVRPRIIEGNPVMCMTKSEAVQHIKDTDGVSISEMEDFIDKYPVFSTNANELENKKQVLKNT